METKQAMIVNYERVIGQIKVDLMKLEEDKKFLKKRLKQLEKELKELEDDNMCNNLVLKTFKKLDDKTIKFINKFVKFLGE